MPVGRNLPGVTVAADPAHRVDRYAELIVRVGANVQPGQMVLVSCLVEHAELARAVGAANGANPIAIVLPCHRVIGSDGRLTGYAGGLERKASLLRLEGVLTEADQASLF